MSLPDFFLLLIDLLLSGFLLYLSILDFRKHRIRDLHLFAILLPLSLLRVTAGAVHAALSSFPVLPFICDHFLGAAAAFGIFYGSAWVLYRAEERKSGKPGKPGIGGGDIKLISILGLAGGVTGLITTVLAGFLLGIPVSFFNRLRGRRYTALAGFFSFGFLFYLLLSDCLLR
ncbi:MAG: prepilin peptidase [Clostridia bacterium]|nr:prepilin peptidase [Clostridia bacterium]